MRFAVLTGHALGVTAAVVLLAGCSGGVPLTTPGANGLNPTSPQSRGAARYHPMVTRDGVMSVLPAGFTPNRQRPSWLRSAPANATGDGGLAVAQFGALSVLWFDKQNNRHNKPPVVCEPASSTNGIRIDRQGNLWVPDGRANTTTEYAPNCGAAKLTIPDPTGEPADVGFDRKGHVYIMNINDISGPPTVAVYNSGGNQIGTLSDPSFATLFGVGSDNKGNVFVSNQTSNNVGNVVEFPGGKMPGTALTGVSLGLPGTPAFDRSNNLIISDWLALTIDVFAPPYDKAPTTSPLNGFAIWCPLNHKETRIYCGDAENGSIDVYAYPGGAYLYSYTADLSSSALVTGVATDPPAKY